LKRQKRSGLHLVTVIDFFERYGIRPNDVAWFQEISGKHFILFRPEITSFQKNESPAQANLSIIISWLFGFL
jgi:hypothetical protein